MVWPTLGSKTARDQIFTNYEVPQVISVSGNPNCLANVAASIFTDDAPQ